MEKEDPDGLRATRKTIARLEWETCNPFFSATQDKERLDYLLSSKKLLRHVAAEGQSSSIGFSWPFFLKKLWEEEDLLREQFAKVQYESECDDPKKFVEDPRFGQTLYEIGCALAPFSFDMRNDPETASMERIIHLAKDALAQEWGRPERSAIEAIYLKGVRRIQWEEILAFKSSLEKVVERPDLFHAAKKLTDGYFRDFLLYESWKRESQKTPAGTERCLDSMQDEIPDGARANRAADLMNRHVRAHYGDGTFGEDAFRVQALFQEWSDSHAPEQKSQLEKIFDKELKEGVSPSPSTSGSVLGNYIDWETFFKEAHAKRKTEAQAQWKTEGWISPNLLYVFSDAVSRQPTQEAMSETSYAVRIVAEVAGRRMEQIDQEGDLAKSAADVQAWLQKRLPEACMLRDFI